MKAGPATDSSMEVEEQPRNSTADAPATLSNKAPTPPPTPQRTVDKIKVRFIS